MKTKWQAKLNSLKTVMLATGTLFVLHLAGGQCDPPANGLAAWWPAEGTAVDVIGTNNGSLHGNVVYTAGKAGQGFVFNGTGGYVQTPPVTKAMSEGTVELWFNLNTWNWNSANNGLYIWAGTQGAPVNSGTPNGGDGINLGNHRSYTSTGELMFGIYEFGVGGRGWLWAHSGLVPQTNTWYHVAGTWGASGIRLYVNGAITATNSYTAPAPTNSLYNIIGRSSWPGTGINGLVDEVSIYNRALSASEIAAIYAAGGAGKCRAAGVGIALYPGVKIDGVAGLTYGIQYSTNLADTNSWIGVTNLTFTQPTEIWYDSIPSSLAQRFYRVLQGPIPIP